MLSYYIGLSLVSNKRQKTARREILSAEGRRVLSLLDGKAPEARSPERPDNKPDIDIDESGRPFFTDHRADFSISHSGTAAAVSFVKGEAPAARTQKARLRTGCDIELVRPRANIKKIAEKFFSAAERDYIFTAGEADKANKADKADEADEALNEQMKFFQIWTLKECFIKLRGLSVFNMAEAPSFINRDAKGRLRFAFCSGGGGVETAPPPLSFFLYELAGPDERYILASAVEGIGLKGTELKPGGLKPEIRWFSQSSLTARSIAEINAAPSPPETVSPKM